MRTLVVATGLLIGFLARASAAPPMPATPGTDEARLSVEIDGDLLTINAREVPLAEVLRAIGESAELTVTVRGEAAQSVSISLTKVPVADGLRLLLRDIASSVVTRTAAGRLAEVRVRLLSTGRVSPPGAAATVPPTSRAAVAVAPDASTGDLAITPGDPYEDRLAFVRQAIQAPRQDALDTLATLAIEDEDPLLRSSAANALGRQSSEPAGEALTAALADPDRRVRRSAARALGRLGGEQATEALGRVLVEERSATVRRMAAFALGRIGSDAALAVLEPARFDRDRTVRTLAEVALTRRAE